MDHGKLFDVNLLESFLLNYFLKGDALTLLSLMSNFLKDDFLEGYVLAIDCGVHDDCCH